jgi:hypothetical protein
MINHQLKTWVNFSTPEARSIVRKILASTPHRELGLKTHEIYERAHEEFPDVTTDIPAGKPIPTGLRIMEAGLNSPKLYLSLLKWITQFVQ